MTWRVALAAVGVTVIAPTPRSASSAPSWWSRLRTRKQGLPPDPFAVLEVQFQLGRVSDQLRALYAEPRVWARGRRVIAIQSAYDSLLATACRLADIETIAAVGVPGLTVSTEERERQELELFAHGWVW